MTPCVKRIVALLSALSSLFFHSPCFPVQVSSGERYVNVRESWVNVVSESVTFVCGSLIGYWTGGVVVGLSRRRSCPSFSFSFSSPSLLTYLVRNTHVTPPASHPRSLTLAFALVIAMSAPSHPSPCPRLPPPPEAGEPVFPLTPASAVPLAASLLSPQFPSEVVVSSDPSTSSLLLDWP